MDDAMPGLVFGAPGFAFGRAPKPASAQLAGSPAPHEDQVWHELPDPSGVAPYRLDLEAVLGDAAVSAIARSGRLVFHTVGDTGGIDNAAPQQIVAYWLEK